MSGPDTPMPDGGVRGRFSPGIRMKLFGFLLPLVFLLIVTVAFAVTEITEFPLRGVLPPVRRPPRARPAGRGNPGERPGHRLRRDPGHVRPRRGARPDLR